MTRIVDMPVSRPKCAHTPNCTRVYTKQGYKPVCELDDTHITNYHNMCLRNGVDTPTGILDEAYRRDIKLATGPETEQWEGVVHGYKMLFVTHKGELQSPRHPWAWPSKYMYAECTELRPHPLGSKRYNEIHFGWTGCGLYFFEGIRDAFHHLKGLGIAYRAGVDLSPVLVNCVLYGTVLDVDFDEGSRAKGYQCGKARIENLWISDIWADRGLLASQLYDIPMASLDALQESMNRENS